ncbi:hypothetical protein [uncultured Treponema sp.]|nr:hypothetical protein [uncultured Treponema sp.]
MENNRKNAAWLCRLLNSLEDSANHIMAIFTVQRLTYEKTKLKV